MEILSSTATKNPQFLSLVSPTTTNIFNNRRTPPTPSFKFPLITSSSRRRRASPIFPLRTSPYFRVFAQFDRPTTTRRINHLRKKLIQQHLLPNPTITSSTLDPLSNSSIPYSTSNNPDIHNLSHTTNTDRDASSSSSLLLWNQLQDWANQHNVRLNQHDILTSSPPFQPSLTEVQNLNIISHANLLLPKQKMENAKNTSFVSKSASFPKLSKFGISVFCLPLLLLLPMAFNSFSLQKEKGDDDRKDYYCSLDKEMLRRKLKARMEKHKSINSPRTSSTVEVIQDEPEIVFKETRPSLNKEELMHNIVNEVKVLDGYGTCLDFDDKIQEIRAMARHVR